MTTYQLLLDNFPFDRMIEVPAEGQSGGLVVLWDDSILELDDITTTRQEIHVIIKLHNSKFLWLFSCIYASNVAHDRNILWKNLKTIKDNYKGLWLLGVILMNSYENQKKRGRPIISTHSNSFWDIINYCELIDMGFKGSKYMWVNECFKNKSSLILEKLDRFFANDDWLHCFPDA